jgi:hypothetical protein
MTYQPAQALRTALENRLLAQSAETGASLDRLRRRLMFERIIARIQAAEPGQWVLKGGMALEVRLRDDARLTKDVDLGLRDDVNSAPDLHERLIEILAIDLDHDYFIFTVGPPERLRDDSGGFPTWRAKVGAQLADKPFGRVQLDVSPRTHELHATDRLVIPSSLAFACVPAVEVEAIDIHRHAAEKFHGMLRDFGERETPSPRPRRPHHPARTRSARTRVNGSRSPNRMARTQQHRTARRPPAAAGVMAGPLPATCSQPRC